MHHANFPSGNGAWRALAVVVLTALIAPSGAAGDGTEIPPAYRAPTAEEAARLDIDCRDGDPAVVKDAERIAGRTYGVSHPKYAELSLCAAHLFADHFDFPSANAHYETAIAIYEALPANQRAEYDDALADFADLLMNEGRYDAALAMAQKRLAEPGSGNVGANLRDDALAQEIDIYSVMGDLAQAEATARTRLAEATALKTADTDLIPPQWALAQTLLLEGKNEDALEPTALAFNESLKQLNEEQFATFLPQKLKNFAESTFLAVHVLQANGRSDEALVRLDDLAQRRNDYQKTPGRLLPVSEDEIEEEYLYFYIREHRYADAAAAANRLVAIRKDEGAGRQRDFDVNLATAMQGLAQCLGGQAQEGFSIMERSEKGMAVGAGVLASPVATAWWSRYAICALLAKKLPKAIALARTGTLADRALIKTWRPSGSAPLAGVLDRDASSELVLLQAESHAAGMRASDAMPLRDEQFAAAQQLLPSSVEYAAGETAAGQLGAAQGYGELIQSYKRAEASLADIDSAIAQMIRLAAAAQQNQAAAAGTETYLASLRVARQQAQAEVTRREDALRAAFPRYFLLRQTAAVPLAGLTGAHGGGILRPGEALVLLTPGSMQLPGGYRNGFVFVVTSDAPPVWAPLDLDADAMSAAIKAVRAQLEGDGKTRPSDVAGTAWGAKGFDRKASYTLYTSLFGNAAVAERLAKAGHWIIVPQGAFLSLPFAALVTADPAGGGAGDADPEALRATQWLGIGKTLSIVPSVSSLVLLRSAERAAAPRRPATFFGIGEPSMDLWKTALDGDATLRDVIPASRRSQILGLPPIANSEIGPLATAPDIKKLGVLTGPAATEGNLRAAAGPLSQADIVLFATHGLVGTNTTEKLDPVLVLTPPAAMAPGTSYDDATKNDGLLSATEVAALQLNADWVVLSACNTAAGNGTAEGLSGLARAFFSAGARSLLVSQWSLENDVARPLVEGTVVQTIGGGSGQAAALRREMQNLLKDRSRDDVGRSFAHPARWAVFEYVGAD